MSSETCQSVGRGFRQISRLARTAHARRLPWDQSAPDNFGLGDRMPASWTCRHQHTTAAEQRERRPSGGSLLPRSQTGQTGLKLDTSRFVSICAPN